MRESLQLFGLLSAFLVILVALVLFARLEPASDSVLVQFDVDLGRFSERLRNAATGTEGHIGWLLGIAVAFLAGSFIATLTRHSWADGDVAAQRVGLFSVSISALTSPFVLLLIAGSFIDEDLLPASLMSAFTFFVVALLAIYVGRFASMTLDERLERLESDIAQARALSRDLASAGRWRLSAVVSLAIAVGVPVVAGVGVFMFAGVSFEIAGGVALALILAAVASVPALLAFALAVGIRVARDLYTRILIATMGLGTFVTSVLAVWLAGDGMRYLVALTLTIALSVPVLSAVLPGRLASSRLTIAGAARNTAARLLDRRVRKLMTERDRLLRQRSPFISK